MIALVPSQCRLQRPMRGGAMQLHSMGLCNCDTVSEYSVFDGE